MFLNIIDLRQYKNKNLWLIFSKDEVNETLDMWMNYFLRFNRTYIIQYGDKCDYNIHEESRYIHVLSPSGFINQKHETRCYLNLNLRVQYDNIIFTEMILNINCEYIFNYIDTYDHDFILNHQKVVILEELQNNIWTNLQWRKEHNYH